MAGWIADVLLALVSAVVVSLCVAAWCVFMLLGVHLVDIDIWTAHGREPWTISHHQAFGVDWINITKQYAPLLSPVEEAGTPPSWALQAISPMDQYDHNARVAVLGAGWPMIQVARVWVTTRNDELFPPSAEFDVSGSCLDMGKSRLWEPPMEFVWFPQAVAIDAVPWFALFLAGLRLHRARSRRRAIKMSAAAG